MVTNHIYQPIIKQTAITSTVFNITNLIEDREYEFRIIAVNDAGEGKPATTSRKVLVKDPKGTSIRNLNNILFHHIPTINLMINLYRKI